MNEIIKKCLGSKNVGVTVVVPSCILFSLVLTASLNFESLKGLKLLVSS